MSAVSELFAVEARRAYDGYLRLCIECPSLATYENARRNDLPAPKKLWKSYSEFASKYVWFVAYMLKVFDDLLRYDMRENWDDALLAQLEFHGPSLAAIWPEHWSGIYSPKLGKLVDKVIKGMADA